jgi:hypothetical protein
MATRDAVQYLGGSVKLVRSNHWFGTCLGLVALRARRMLERLLLNVVGDREEGDAALRQR